MKNKILMVYNPNSGIRSTSEVIQTIKKRLEEKGFTTELKLTKRPNHATEIVKKANDFDIVFSLGGDGTLNEVVNGNIQRERQMSVCPLPTGSCNDVATMLGYKKNLVENIELAINGEEKTIDIGTINGKAFTYVVGMGKFMHIPYDTPKDAKSTIGYLAYIREGLKEFFNKTKKYKAKIEVDGVELDGKYSFIMISNSNHIAGVSGLYNNVKLDDEKFEVLLCKSKNISSFIASFLEFYLNGNPKDMVSLQASDIKIILENTPSKNWCIDGEKLIDNPKEYHIKVSHKMDFIVPKEKTKKLFLH